MHKKVAVVGLYSLPNMGDQMLCETTIFLLKKICKDIEIIKLDVFPKKRTDRTVIERIERRLSSRMIKKAKKRFEYKDGSKRRYVYERRMWKMQVFRYYEKTLKEADAIVFAGGGFVKFRTQGLNYYTEMIIEIAQKYNIPVMMNAVGIEGYNEQDFRCMSLKKHINSNVVKVITTRDNVELLDNYYIYNKNIKTDLVGDPALWAPDCYNVHKNQSSTKIGINIIRENIFKDYGNRLTAEEMLSFYIQLISELEKRSVEWVLFSNGMKSDQKFGRKLLDKLGMSEDERMISPPTRAEELLETIKGFKCIFGARLHACISSYALGVPVVGFIWNEKTELFARQIKKDMNFFNENNLDVCIIVDRLLEAAEEDYDKNILDYNRNKTFMYLQNFVEKHLVV